MPLYWRVIFRFVLKEMYYTCVRKGFIWSWIDKVAVFLEQGNKTSDSIKGTEFLWQEKRLLDFDQSLFCIFS